MAVAPPPPRPFWSRRKWVVGHVLVVVLVGLAVWAGFWQLDRLAQRRAANAEVAARAELPPAPIGELADPGDPTSVGEDLRYRRATATGTYDADGEVLIRSVSLQERPGYWVVTPLVLDDGDAVAVNRGFVPFTDDLAAARAAGPPPAGEVEVEGLLAATQERQGIGPTDPAEGRLEALARLDVGRIEQQYDAADLYPVALQLQEQVPAQEGPLPVPVPPPTADEGNHLSYAVQWFLFAAVGAIGWPVLLVRTARDEDEGEGAGGGGPGPVGGGRHDDGPSPPFRDDGHVPAAGAGAGAAGG